MHDDMVLMETEMVILVGGRRKKREELGRKRDWKRERGREGKRGVSRT